MFCMNLGIWKDSVERLNVREDKLDLECCMICQNHTNIKNNQQNGNASKTKCP